MKKTNIYFMTSCALMAALTCIGGPMSVPIGPIPVSLTNLILYFAIFLLGTKGTLASYAVYMLLGAFGLPVFSGFSGGLGKLTGPTGGYLVGFFLMILVMGIVMEKTKGNVIFTFLGMVLGTMLAYLLGTAWFVFSMKTTVAYALTVCVFPFIPFDLAKMVIAIILGKTVRAALIKGGLIDGK